MTIFTKIKKTKMTGEYYFNGNIFHFKNGRLHREDGPAVEASDGVNEFWTDGTLTKIEGPSISITF